MRIWKDSQGKSHQLKLDGRIAQRLKSVCEFDLLKCLVDRSHMQMILTQLAMDPALLMAVCAETEGIQPDGQDEYFSNWDGDSFEQASSALVEAIADFFPVGPRQILLKLMEKTRAASAEIQPKVMDQANRILDQMDFTSELEKLLIPGNGGTASVPSLDSGPSS
jgi:hypothetical protein